MYLACGLLAGLRYTSLDKDAPCRRRPVSMSFILWLEANGEGRGNNHLDGAALYYRAYETKDGKFVAVGALEQKFTRNLLIASVYLFRAPERLDPANWEKLITSFETI